MRVSGLVPPTAAVTIAIVPARRHQLTWDWRGGRPGRWRIRRR